MKKECQFILLPTKEASNIHLEDGGILMLYKKARIYSNTTPQHLYVISDDEIKEGDWYIDLYKNIYQRNGLVSDKCKKIIATTNPELLIEEDIISIPQRKGLTDNYIVERKTNLLSISQSDIEYIISLYNGKGKEVEKSILNLSSESMMSASEKIMFKSGYNQCLQDNVDKKFTLEDIKSVVRKSIYLKGGFDKEGFSFYKDDNEIMDECIQSLTKEQLKNDTVTVEYESGGLPSKQIKIGGVDLTEFNDNPYKPKLKDNCIIIHQ